MQSLPALVLTVLNSLALIYLISNLYGLLKARLSCRPPWQQRLLLGALFGLFGAASMLLGYADPNAMAIDARNVYVMMAVLLLGPGPAMLALGIVIVARWLLLGPELFPLAVMIASLSYLCALLLRATTQPGIRHYRPWQVLALGWVAGLLSMILARIMLPALLQTLSLEEVLISALLCFVSGGLLLALWSALRLDAERREAIIELEGASKRLREIINAMPFAVLISRLKDRRIVFSNAALAQLMNPANGTGQGDDTLKYYANPRDRERMLEILERDGVVRNFVVRSQRPDGSQGWFSLSVQPIHYEGEPALLGAYLDITSMKELEESLQLSRARYEAAAAASSASIWEWLPESDRIIISPSFPALLGYEDQAIAPTLGGWQQIVWPEDWTLFNETLHSMLDTPERIRELEYRLRRADGQPIWMLFRGRVLLPLPLALHEEQRLLGFHTDITDLKQFQELLHRRDIILQSVSSSAEWFLQHQDFESHIQEMLALMGRGVGADRSYIFEVTRSAEGVPIWRQRYEWCAPGIEPQIDTPELQHIPYLELAPQWAEMMADGRPVTGHTYQFGEAEKLLLEPQGIQSIAIVPIHISGNWWGFIGFDMCRAEREWDLAEIEALQIAADLLGAAFERRNVQRALEESEARFRLIAENSSDLICLHAVDGRIVYANPATQQALGYTPDEVVGTMPADYVHPEDLKTVRDELLRPLARHDARVAGPVTYRFRHKSGEYRWFETSGQLVRNADGQPFQIVSSSRDVSVRIEAEQRIRQLALEQEKVGLLRQFISDASHDFRTPLSSINTSLYLLRRSWEDGERRERYVGNIATQTARMDHLLENLLMMVRLDSGMPLKLASLQVSDALRRVHARVLERARSKKISLMIDLSSELTLIEGDAEVLDAAIWHVIENAVHYTPEGGQVHLDLRVEGNRCVLQVKDNGIGIHEMDQPFIFNRFYRVDQARPTDTGGSGLGLTIAQKAMELHGGRIEFESEKGVGSTFRLILPLRGTPRE